MFLAHHTVCVLCMRDKTVFCERGERHGSVLKDKKRCRLAMHGRANRLQNFEKGEYLCLFLLNISQTHFVSLRKRRSDKGDTNFADWH
ncbi:hypothetical protein CEXT_752651 [Caerostris extrusa]|uniref:Uncharacterized protein n=1 Tax=Caerostris extrusa TaxID=172846 RepID=A0AAV4PXI0_CAEEX|nr:hypothetical protein CEXT_752651 [Caerostris extrusa]